MSVFMEILPSFHSSIVAHSLHKGPKTYLTRTHLIGVWFPDFFLIYLNMTRAVEMTPRGSDIVSFGGPTLSNVSGWGSAFTWTLSRLFGVETFERLSVILLLSSLGSEHCILSFQLTMISGYILVFVNDKLNQFFSRAMKHSWVLTLTMNEVRTVTPVDVHSFTHSF